MGSLGTTFALFIALCLSGAPVFAAEATQSGGTSAKPSHEGEENPNGDAADPNSSEKSDPDEELTAGLDEMIDAATENPDDQPTLLLDAKEAIENRIAALKEAILKEDDPTKKAELEKKLDKLSKAAERIANVLTANRNAKIAKIEAAKAAETTKTSPTATTPVPALDSTHQKTPQISTSNAPGGSRSVPSSNEGSGNRSYAYSDRTNGNKTVAVAPRTPTPSGKSSIPQRISSPSATSSSSAPAASSAVAATPSSSSSSAPSVTSGANMGSTPIVSGPTRLPASSPSFASIEMPKLSAPAMVDLPASGAAPISRRQAEAAGVSVAPTPQARLTGNAIASVDNPTSEYGRGITRKNEIGSTKNLYPAIASGSNNAEAPKGSGVINPDIYEKAPVYDSKPAANSFYGKTSSARAQGQYIVLGNKGEEGDSPEVPTDVTTVAVTESVPVLIEKPTGPAKFARAAFKPVPTYNSPAVKDPIVEKTKAAPDALASKKLDFKNFRENPFL